MIGSKVFFTVLEKYRNVIYRMVFDKLTKISVFKSEVLK